MKVKIKDLEPNPYRDMNNYPMDEAKVKSLVESITQTGFWDNILARKHGNKFQIAYGHHRLAAIREVFKPTDEVDIPVKELTDALMIQIMAKENDDNWKTNPKIIDETIKVTRKFLDEHPEEVSSDPGQNDIEYSREAFRIHKFLDWPEFRVYKSLERLQMIADGRIEKEVIENMPSTKAADRFISAVKKHETPIGKQRIIAERLEKEDSFSEQSISDAFVSEKYTTPKKKQEYQSEKIIKYESYIAEIRNSADDLLEALRKLMRTEKELGIVPENLQRKLLEMTLNSLSKQIKLITKKQDNEESKSTNANPASIAR